MPITTNNSLACDGPLRSINKIGTNRFPCVGLILVRLQMMSRSQSRPSHASAFTTTNHPIIRTMKKSIPFLTLAVLTAFASVSPAYADTHTWSGAAITPNWSTPANWAGNNPPYAGEPAPVYTVFPAGALRQINYCNIANLVV